MTKTYKINRKLRSVSLKTGETGYIVGENNNWFLFLEYKVNERVCRKFLKEIYRIKLYWKKIFWFKVVKK